MPADLKSLQLFVAVADHGSISEGAKRCHLALAAASKRMAELEARARLPLLVRHARGVVLTPAGHALLAHARTVLLAMDRMRAELDDFHQGIAGVVRIVANASSIAQFLPAQIGAFLRAHPALKIDLEEHTSVEVAKRVSGSLADIGVLESHTLTDGLECLPYREDELAVVVGREHALARRPRGKPQAPVSVEQMLRHDHIVVGEGSALHRALTTQAHALRLPLKVRMRVGSFDVACRMIEEGAGIGLMPRAAITPQLATMRLHCLTLDAPWAQRRHLLCVRELGTLTVAARSVLDFLARAPAPSP